MGGFGLTVIAGGWLGGGCIVGLGLLSSIRLNFSKVELGNLEILCTGIAGGWLGEGCILGSGLLSRRLLGGFSRNVGVGGWLVANFGGDEASSPGFLVNFTVRSASVFGQICTTFGGMVGAFSSLIWLSLFP